MGKGFLYPKELGLEELECWKEVPTKEEQKEMRESDVSGECRR
jgi:hypothetical protein